MGARIDSIGSVLGTDGLGGIGQTNGGIIRTAISGRKNPYS